MRARLESPVSPSEAIVWVAAIIAVASVAHSAIRAWIYEKRRAAERAAEAARREER
jgi:hypothetical protein